MSENELQYGGIYEESDESGSDYEVVPDSEEEALMVNAAIEASHKTARRETRQRSGAGPSTSGSRVTAGEAVIYTVESEEELYEDFAKSDDESELSVLESSDDEPVSKRKGKAKAKANKGKAKISTEPLTWAERTEQRRLARQERNEAKREERLLAKQLGRRLTWVCPRSTYQMGVCSTYITGGEDLLGIGETSSRAEGCVGGP
jgi:hypothetical protein